MITFKKVKNEDGLSAIEYSLLSALIAIIILAIVYTTGARVEQTFCYVAGHMLGDGVCGGLSIEGNTGDSGNNTLPQGVPDGVSSSMVDTSMGGTDNVMTNGPAIWGSTSLNWVTNTMSLLNDINSKDPITGIYGIYNWNRQPETTLSAVLASIPTKPDGISQYMLTSGSQSDYFQFKTASGNVYKVQVGGGWQQTQAVNTVTGNIINCSSCN